MVESKFVIALNADVPAKTVQEFIAYAGHPSTVALVLDRSQLDYRRVAVSNPKVAGQSLGDLRLRRRFGAVATRVRRGDVDLLATDDLVLQIGDRVRIVAERRRIAPPTTPKPRMSMAQVVGSGTAEISSETPPRACSEP